MNEIDLNFEEKYTTANGTEECGFICVRYLGSKLTYMACGISHSRWFKTLKGARKYMVRNGYKPIK